MNVIASLSFGLFWSEYAIFSGKYAPCKCKLLFSFCIVERILIPRRLVVLALNAMTLWLPYFRLWLFLSVFSHNWRDWQILLELILLDSCPFLYNNKGLIVIPVKHAFGKPKFLLRQTLFAAVLYWKFFSIWHLSFFLRGKPLRRVIDHLLYG